MSESPESTSQSAHRTSSRPGGLSKAQRLAELVDATNKEFNLTAIKGAEAIYNELVLDSLVFLPALDAQARNLTAVAAGNREEGAAPPWPLKILDLGSGAGIPGVPIALARPGWSVTCLEATGKKARFIENTAAELGLANVEVLNARSEEAGHDAAHRERYDAVVMRFVAPMPVACELGLPFLRPMGWLWAVKFAGKEAENEARQAAAAARALGGDEVEIRPAQAPAGLVVASTKAEPRVVLGSQKIAPTPSQYPRAPGVPKSRPLGASGAKTSERRGKPDKN